MGILTDDQRDIITYALYGSSTLSLVGAFVIIMTFLIFKDTRTFGTKLIFFLSFSDFFCSLSW
jgi:hypothetical protein